MVAWRKDVLSGIYREYIHVVLHGQRERVSEIISLQVKGFIVNYCVR